MQLFQKLREHWRDVTAKKKLYKRQMKRFDATQICLGKMGNEDIEKAVEMARAGWVIVCITVPTVVNFPVYYAVEKTVLALSDDGRRITAAAIIHRDWNRRCSFDECHMGIHMSSSKMSGHSGDDVLTLLQLKSLRTTTCLPCP